MGETPEEDAWKKIEPRRSQKGCLKRGLAYSAGTHIRLKHGYEYFLTVGQNIEPDGDIDMRQGGIYAVLRFKNLDNIGNAWEHLWNWIRENKYEYIGIQNGEHCWFNGFEEQVNWHEGSCRKNGCLICGCN